MSDDMEFIHRRGGEDAEFPQREITEKVIAAAIEVHRVLGPGLLESVYQHALEHEFRERGIAFESQIAVPIRYKSVAIEPPLRLDLLVERQVIVEVKAIAAFDEIHRAQLLTYLRLSQLESGLLINFNVVLLKHGLKRVVNSLRSSASSALCGEGN